MPQATKVPPDTSQTSDIPCQTYNKTPALPENFRLPIPLRSLRSCSNEKTHHHPNARNPSADLHRTAERSQTGQTIFSALSFPVFSPCSIQGNTTEYPPAGKTAQQRKAPYRIPALCAPPWNLLLQAFLPRYTEFPHWDRPHFPTAWTDKQLPSEYLTDEATLY